MNTELRSQIEVGIKTQLTKVNASVQSLGTSVTGSIKPPSTPKSTLSQQDKGRD